MSRTKYKNAEQMPTWKLREILNNPLCAGIDGADYEPHKETLQTELWKRDNAESERLLAAFHKQQKELFNHTYKKGKTA